MKILHILLIVAVGSALACSSHESGVGARASALEQEAAPANDADEIVEVEPEPGAAIAWRVPTHPVGDGLPPAGDDAAGVAVAEPVGRGGVPCDAPGVTSEELAGCPRDVDGDGAREDIDCDDTDPRVHPLARETVCDDLDQNCDGHDTCDHDGDGVVDWVDPAPDDPDVGRHVASPDVGPWLE